MVRGARKVGRWVGADGTHEPPRSDCFASPFPLGSDTRSPETEPSSPVSLSLSLSLLVGVRLPRSVFCRALSSCAGEKKIGRDRGTTKMVSCRNAFVEADGRKWGRKAHFKFLVPGHASHTFPYGKIERAFSEATKRLDSVIAMRSSRGRRPCCTMREREKRERREKEERRR